MRHSWITTSSYCEGDHLVVGRGPRVWSAAGVRVTVSRRTERVASLIRTLLAEAIQTKLHDPRIPPITSITEVEIDPEFSRARVYVSVLESDPKRKLCIEALQSSAGLLRRQIGGDLHLRRTPVLDFHLDDSLRHGFETVQLIDQAMAELEQRSVSQPPQSDDNADSPHMPDEPDQEDSES